MGIVKNYNPGGSAGVGFSTSETLAQGGVFLIKPGCYFPATNGKEIYH